jgi:predicted ATP-grasp superfamily ATP-dependent carboligase
MPVHVRVPRRDLKKCTPITGFHGIGETSYIALSYHVHALRAERIGFVEVKYPLPFIATTGASPFHLKSIRRGMWS